MFSYITIFTNRYLKPANIQNNTNKINSVSMQIREIFENLIKIEPKVMSIESLFNNKERVENTDYRPAYQRNYVWDDEKATYFIESILIGTEIPPLIYFKNGDLIEVIDGRQRYETILRFINNDFKLKRNGLEKLEHIGIANKYFKSLGELKDLFWDTKLRIIEFSFHSKNINADIEDIVKKEIFKRYNSGITPLTPTDIAKAVYIDDDVNTFIKKKLQNDAVLYGDILSLLHFEKSNTEVILKKIRHLLVQHHIPIKYYSIKKDTVISKYYEYLFSNISSEDIIFLFKGFIEKINLIKKIKAIFNKREVPFNRLITECLFWAFSILESEGHNLKELSVTILESLVDYIRENIVAFEMDRSSFAQKMNLRYLKISDFFSQKFNIDFAIFLQYNDDFKEKNSAITPDNQERTSFDELRINKPEPSSIAIVDICRQMERQRFLIRPPYQRNEVINKKKSSAIIESILLGIKLPPIFVFKRDDGISEVLDGQQRLLSILGFMQKPYLDENNAVTYSNKNGYSLNLKNSILTNLNSKKFSNLLPEQQNKIRNFDLWIIEISQKNNEKFEPIDLFIRLNNKPYPIKENTFEMWNSYISRDIIEAIQNIQKKNKEWLYFRKNNTRMEDENIYTSLVYLHFSVNTKGVSKNEISNDLDVYKVVDKINFRLKSKNEITKVLEDGDSKEEFLQACNDFENIFVKKLKELLEDENDKSIPRLNQNLDFIFDIENGRRTQQSYYALWFFLYNVSNETIVREKIKIREHLKHLFSQMRGIESKADFDKKVIDFRDKHTVKLPPFAKNILDGLKHGNYTILTDVAVIAPGLSSVSSLEQLSETRVQFPFAIKAEIENYQLRVDEIGYISLDEKPSLKVAFEACLVC
jgi:hypothetical protein